jgi:hypothetical protein
MKSLAIAAALISALACGSAPVFAAVKVDASLAATVDDSDGRGIDADLGVAPGEHFNFNVGVGHFSASDETSDVTGTTWRLGAGVHGSRAGAALSYDNFEDGSNYRSATLGARAWFEAGDLTLSVIGRHRQHEIAFDWQLPQRVVRREMDFTATGFGFEASYSIGNWSGYLGAIAYEFDDSFEDFVNFARSPQVVRRPRVEALVANFITLTQGAIDREARVGVERAFGRHSVALDATQVRDAITEEDSVSVALTWSFAQSARLDWSLSGGFVDSDSLGNIAFAGVALGVSN